MTDEQPTFAMAADPLIGRVLDGRYRVVRRLAKGGMGRVYVGEQVGLDRTVAIKVSWTDGAPVDDTFRERFFREARLCSRLSHPNTVRIFDYGRTPDDVFYIAMEYLSGPTLGEILRAGPLEPLRAVAFAQQVCASLAEAHGLGLVHRDLKPDNLIVTRPGDGREFVRIVDFGIAKDTYGTDAPTQKGLVFGSPGYMSPEQLLEQPVTARSDLYSLGAILYRALTGAKPFGDEPAAALTRQVTGSPRPFAEANPAVVAPGRPSLSALEGVVMRCLERDPAARLPSVASLARALAVCELQLRGFLALDGPLAWQDGELVLPSGAEDVLARFAAGTGHTTPAPSVRVEGAPSVEGVEPTLPPETRSWPSQASRSWRSPSAGVLVRGPYPAVVAVGLGSMVVVPALLLGAFFFGWMVVRATAPAVGPLPPLGAPEPTDEVAPEVAPVATPAPEAAPAAASAPAAPIRAPSPRRPGRTEAGPAPAEPAPAEPALDPVPADADPVPADPVPAEPVPTEPALDSMGRSDLRDPFAD